MPVARRRDQSSCFTRATFNQGKSIRQARHSRVLRPRDYPWKEKETNVIAVWKNKGVKYILSQ